MVLADKQFNEYLVTTREEMFVSEKTHVDMMSVRTFRVSINTLPMISYQERYSRSAGCCVRCENTQKRVSEALYILWLSCGKCAMLRALWTSGPLSLLEAAGRLQKVGNSEREKET